MSQIAPSGTWRGRPLWGCPHCRRTYTTQAAIDQHIAVLHPPPRPPREPVTPEPPKRVIYRPEAAAPAQRVDLGDTADITTSAEPEQPAKADKPKAPRPTKRGE